MYEGLISNLHRAADKWEKEHPIIGVGQLRVHDALRDAARALKEADSKLEQVTLERNAAIVLMQRRNPVDDYITVMVKGPGRPWRESRVRNNLTQLQALVGGYIETVPVYNGMLLLVNEEGKLRWMDANFEYRQDILFGPVVAGGIQVDSFTSCPIMTDVGMRIALGLK